MKFRGRKVLEAVEKWSIPSRLVRPRGLQQPDDLRAAVNQGQAPQPSVGAALCHAPLLATSVPVLIGSWAVGAGPMFHMFPSWRTARSAEKKTANYSNYL
jgi:hypothetical protein